MPRPFLTAQWRNLAMLTWTVDPRLLEPYLPPGTEVDTHNGEAFLSNVAFEFLNARLLGWRAPGHQNFAEVNLRFYVRRPDTADPHKGVVFLREIANRRLVAAIANRVYHESYTVLPLTGHCPPAPAGQGASVLYRLRQRGQWRELAARATAGAPQLPTAGSLEAFLINNEWGYSHDGRGRTTQYHVTHPPWRYRPLEDFRLDYDLAAIYPAALLETITAPPVSALWVDGSAVEVFPGQKLPREMPAPLELEL